MMKSLATCPSGKDFPSAISSKYAVNDVLVMEVSLAMLEVHRYKERFQKELATYRRLAERNITRLKRFQFPQMVDYDDVHNKNIRLR